MSYKDKVPSESEILHEALTACGKDRKSVTGVYDFLSTNPTIVICDLLTRKLNEQGYRVIKSYKKRKLGELKNGK